MTSGAGAGQPASRAFFAIGTAEYVDSHYAKSSSSLRQSVPQSLSTVIAAFKQSKVDPALAKPGYIKNPKTKLLRDTLKKAGSAGDIVIIYYTGHGEYLDGDGYYLITADFKRSKRTSTGVKAHELPGLLVRRNEINEDIDPNQPAILLILDCCSSGAAGLAVLKEELLRERLNPNLWVLASAGRIQTAISGVFAEALADALTRPRVGSSSPDVPIETVFENIQEALKLKGEAQDPELIAPVPIKRFPKFFPNATYRPEVGGLTVAEQQHWISKTRAGPTAATAGAGFYLTGCTGRVHAARDLARWINNSAAGRMAFVTGSPGSGKSALLSLPVLLTAADTRGLLLTGTPEGSLAHQTAALLSVDTNIVAVYAHGLNVDKVAEAIARGLGSSAIDAKSLKTALAKPQQRLPVVIVDAVDEATDAVLLRDNLLLPLAEQHGVRVILGARRHVLPKDTQTAFVIDLDIERYRDPQALVDYVRYLLIADREPGLHTPYQRTGGQTHPSTDEVAAQIADLATSESGVARTPIESFLIARVITLAVRVRPDVIDTAVEGWAQQLPDGLAAAFDEDLDRFGERGPTARVLLEALAWARGPGLPWETIWVPLARALASLRGEVQLSHRLSDDDARWLLERAGAYVVEDRGPGGRSVFRPFHDVLGEYLRAQSITANDAGDKDGNARVQAALTAVLLDSLGPSDGRRWDWAHPYLRTYLGEHALASGSDVFTALLDESGFLAVADPSALTPLLGQAKPEQDRIVRSYRRARSLLGEDPAANAAYLCEAALSIGGTPISFVGEAIAPAFQTKWTHVRPDDSLLTLTGHKQEVNSVAFGTDAGGRTLLASGGHDGTVRLWDPSTGDPMGQPLKGHRWVGLSRLAVVNSVAFGIGADGNLLLASAGAEGTVCLWNPNTGELVRQLRVATGWTEIVTSVAFGAEAEGRVLLAAGTDEGTVGLWDADTGAPVWEALTGAGRVTSVAFGTGAGNLLLAAAAGDEGTVWLWDVENRRLVGQPLAGHAYSIDSVAFGADADERMLLACGCGIDNSVRLWEIVSGTLVGQPLTWDSAAGSVAFGAQAGGRLLLACGGYGDIYLWDTASAGRSGERLGGHTSVNSVAFGIGADGNLLLASAGAEGTVRLWRPGTGEQVKDYLDGLFDLENLNEYADDVKSLAFGSGVSGAALLASGTVAGKHIWLWNRDTGAPAGRLPRGGAWVTSMAFGHGRNGQALLAYGGPRGELWLCEPNPGEPVWKELAGHDREVESVAFSAGSDGQALLASAGGSDGTVRLWDPNDGTQVGQPLTAHSQVNSVAFGIGADGNLLLASGGYDDTRDRLGLPTTVGTVRLWDPHGGTQVGQVLAGHEGWVNAVAFGAEADCPLLLASGCSKGTVRLWDPRDGTPMGPPMTGHKGAVISVTFGTAGGRLLLLSAGDDRTVRLWDPVTGVQLMLIRRRVSAAALTSEKSIFAIGDSEGLTVIDMSGMRLMRADRPSERHTSLALRVAKTMLTVIDAVKIRKQNRR